MIRELIWTIRHWEHNARHGIRAWPQSLSTWSRFWRSYRQYRRMAPSDAQPKWKHLLPCLGEDTGQTAVDPIYFYQDAWAFDHIVRQAPPNHIDVGSHHK